MKNIRTCIFIKYITMVLFFSLYQPLFGISDPPDIDENKHAIVFEKGPTDLLFPAHTVYSFQGFSTTKASQGSNIYITDIIGITESCSASGCCSSHISIAAMGDADSQNTLRFASVGGTHAAYVTTSTQHGLIRRIHLPEHPPSNNLEITVGVYGWFRTAYNSRNWTAAGGGSCQTTYHGSAANLFNSNTMGTRDITITYPTLNTLTPGTDYTLSTSAICQGSSVDVTISTYGPGIVYRVRSTSGTIIKTHSGSNAFTLSPSELDQLKNGGTIQFIITRQLANYFEQVDASAARIASIAWDSHPATFSIEGPSAVCPGDYSSDYISAGGADSYLWTISPGDGTINNSAASSTTFNWNSNAGAGTVSLVKANTNGSAQCSTQDSHDVQVYNDVSKNIIATGSTVCYGTSGTVSTNTSVNGRLYRLFAGTTYQNQQVMGTSGGLIFNNVNPGNNYHVREQHPVCGWYTVTGNVNVHENPQSPAPVDLIGETTLCEGSPVSITAVTSNANSGWEWQRRSVEGHWSTIPGETSNSLNFDLGTGYDRVRTRYIDGNGCWSSWRNRNIQWVDIPNGYEIQGEVDVCMNEYEQIYWVGETAEYWNWGVDGGRILSGQGSNQIEVQWAPEADMWAIQVYGENQQGAVICTGQMTTLPLEVRSDVAFFDVEGSSVCTGDNGTIWVEDTQEEFDYYLFNDDGVQLTSTPGNGQNIGFGSLPVGEYEVMIWHSESCGWYSMGNATVMEYVVSEAPSVVEVQGAGYTDVIERCGAGTIDLRVTTPENASMVHFYIDDIHGIPIWVASVPPSQGIAEHSLYVEYGANELSISYIDINGCESHFQEVEVDILEVPVGYDIEGVFDVCSQSYEQTYNANGIADHWEWEVIGGLIIDIVNEETITILWDETAENWQLSLMGWNDHGSSICEGPLIVRDINVRNDVDFPDVTVEPACAGTLGSITLETSQEIYDYHLFHDGVEHSIVPGTGDAMFFGNLFPGSYQISIDHPECSWYVLDEVELQEFQKSPAPTLSGSTEFCLEAPMVFSASTSSANQGWQWEFFLNQVWYAVWEETGPEFSQVLDEGITEIRVAYYDGNGCLSNWAVKDVVYANNPPELHLNKEFYSFCTNDEPYHLSQDVTDPDINFSGLGIEKNWLHPMNLSPGNYEVKAKKVNSDGCSNEQLIDVLIHGTNTIEAVDLTVCDEDGQFLDLRQAVSYDGGKFSSDYVNGGVFFDLDKVKPGSYEVGYEYIGENGCSAFTEFDIHVLGIPSEIEFDTEEIHSCWNKEEIVLGIVDKGDVSHYEWFISGEEQFLGNGSELVVANQAGTYYVVGHGDNGCSRESNLISVVVDDFLGEIKSEPNDTAIPAGEAVLFNTTVDADYYSWDFGENRIRNVKIPSMVFNYGDTTIQVVLTVSNEYGCQKDFVKSWPIVDGSGQFGKTVQNEEQDRLVFITRNDRELILYPNPAIGSDVTLSFYSSREDQMWVEVFDFTNTIRSENYFEIQVGENQLDISLPDISGKVYFLKLRSKLINQIIPGLKN